MLSLHLRASYRNPLMNSIINLFIRNNIWTLGASIIMRHSSLLYLQTSLASIWKVITRLCAFYWSWGCSERCFSFDLYSSYLNTRIIEWPRTCISSIFNRIVTTFTHGPKRLVQIFTTNFIIKSFLFFFLFLVLKITCRELRVLNAFIHKFYNVIFEFSHLSI